MNPVGIDADASIDHEPEEDRAFRPKLAGQRAEGEREGNADELHEQDRLDQGRPGDADLGAGVNVGAGTITANYDGVRKHRTAIGAGSKTGANSTLVAPIRLGENVTVAAGSTLTDDVPAGALAFGRARQVVKDRRG